MDADEVAVLEALPADRPFRRVGVVTAEGTLVTSSGTLEQRLRVLAADAGANAIVLQSPEPLRHLSVRRGGTVKRWGAFAIALE